MGACVEINVNEIEMLAKKLNGYVLSTSDEQSLLQSLGVEMEAQMSERISSTKTDPEGKRWKEIAESTRRFYLDYFPQSRPPLWRKGGLLDSIESQVYGTRLLSGATAKYAGYLQDGTKTMIKRSFAGLSAADIAELSELIDVWLKKRIV